MATRRSNVVLAILGVAVLSAAAFYFLVVRPPGAQGAALSVREKTMEMLGARIAQLRPGSPVLVLSNPFAEKAGLLDQKAQYERAGIRGLQRGLGSKSQVEVRFPEIRPEYLSDPTSVAMPPDCRTPLSFLMSPGAVEKLCAAHPKAMVIVSLIGLPAEVDKSPLWDENDPHCFALLLPDLRLLGTPAAAVAAFQRGKLLAAVVDDTRTGHPLVVTRDNVEEILQSQPKSLGF